MDHETIILTSNSSTLVYNQNSLSKFRNILPTPILNVDNKQIAFESISFENNFANMPVSLQNLKYNIIMKNNEKQVVREVLIPFGRYNYKKLANFISEKCGLSFLKNNNLRFIGDDNQFSIKNIGSLDVYIEKDTFLWLNKENAVSVSDVEIMHDRRFYLIGKNSNRTIFKRNNFSKQILPQLVIVELNEMKTKLTSSGRKKILATLPYSKERQDKLVYHYEGKGQEAHQLANVYNSSFQITLFDQDYKQLSLVDGQPTVITLKMTSSKQEGFYLQVNSNSSIDVHSDNIAASFKNILPAQIDLKGLWKVGGI